MRKQAKSHTQKLWQGNLKKEIESLLIPAQNNTKRLTMSKQK